MFTIESLSDLETISKIFQGFATGIAIIVGAIWALIRFFSLKEVKRANIQIEKEQLQLKQQPIVDSKIYAEQVFTDQKNDIFLSIRIIAKNNGTRLARFSYEKYPPLNIFYVKFEDNGDLSFQKKVSFTVRSSSNPDYSIDASIIFPGHTQIIPFLIKLPKEGWYFITFSTEMSYDEIIELKESGIPENKIVKWAAKKYIYLKKV